MDTITFDVQNFEGFLTGIGIPLLGFLYARLKGFKIASLDKRLEYKELKELCGVLTNNISKDEFLAIVKVVIEKKSQKGGITAADAQVIGKMLVDAVTTEEVKK